jgi:hypothetical protein
MPSDDPNATLTQTARAFAGPLLVSMCGVLEE